VGGDPHDLQGPGTAERPHAAPCTETSQAERGPRAADTSSTEFESWLRAMAQLSITPRARAPLPLWTGARLCGGRFIIGNMLGRGGMGAVYEVRDVERGANLALKILLDRRSERLLAFKNEFRALQDLTHRNLVHLDELFEDHGQWFFTMERIQGVPFTSFVRPGGLDAGRLRQSLVQLTHGLRALHGAKKIHRDVKPSNTLVERGGRVVLLDFGLIGDAGGAKEGRMPGAGTAAYMAPEQVSGDGGPAADWYGVGVMLYQALTGELPFDGPSSTILARKQCERARPPSALAADLPPDLERLCVDLLRREPEGRPNGKEVLQRLSGAGRGAALARPLAADDAATKHFVGRTRELDRLRQALARTDRAGPVTLLICGESGVGKTALLEAFTGELDESVKVLAGRCYEREFVPFKALDGLIDALARHLDRIDEAELLRLLPPRCPALARIFPVLGRTCRRAGLTMEDGEPASPIEARQSAIATLQDLLSGLAARGPLVLAIDDLHWADLDSLAVIESLLQGPAPPHILLILLARSGTTAPSLPGEMTVLQLEALEVDEARELARRLLAENPAAGSHDPERLAQEAGRHPLFMEAMLRHLGAAGSAEHVRLADVLAARVVALPARARALLEVVSLAAQPLSPSLVAQAMDLLAEPLFRLVRTLQSDRLVLSRSGEAQPSIEPYHDQVRHAVVGAMSPERQSSCHRSIAEALERLAPERSEALAVHWRAAGEGRQARRHAIQAGHHARRALAFDRAADFYRLAVELGSGPREEAAELHRWHAEALANSGRGAESAAAYRAAAAQASGHERTDLARRAAEQLLRAGHIDEGLSAMDHVLASFGMTRPRNVSAAKRILVQERLLEICGSIARRVAPLGAARTAKLARRADACWTTGLGLSWLDPVAAAVFQSRHLRISRRLGDPVRIALGLCMRAPEGAFSGPPAARARRTLAKVREIMRGRNDPFVEGYQALAAATVAFLLGAWNEALLHSEDAVISFRRHQGGVAWELATAERFVLDCLWHTGQIRQLRDRTWTAWRDANRRGDRYAVVQFETTVLPVVHLADDDVGSATAVLESTLADWPRDRLSMQHWQHAQTRALVELYAGRPSAALGILEGQLAAPEQALFSRIQAVRVFSAFLRATTLLGVAAHQRGDAGALIRRAKQHARRIDRERASPETVCLLRGQIDLLREDRAGAARHFASAEILFERRGMKLLSAVAAHGQGLASGGDGGRARMAEARRWMLAQEIRYPEGFLRLFAPVLGVV
jgi:hypothetical protein